MRITGLSSGLDVDTLVTDSMKPYRVKIDQIKQQKDLAELKQTMYRDITKDARNFFNKYLDILGKDSFLMSDNIKTTKYTSDNVKVVTASDINSSNISNYEIEVTQIATSSSAVVKMDDVLGKSTIKITVGDKDVEVDLTGVLSTEDLYKKVVDSVKELGLKASQSDFSGGVIIETVNTGYTSDNSNIFSITVGNKSIDSPGALIDEKIISVTAAKNVNATITNSRGEKIVFDDKNLLSSNKIVLDGVEFCFKGQGSVSISGEKDASELVDKIANFIDEYNALMIKINTLTKEKKQNTYLPLTSDQKEEMSEDEIKLWNDKVKEGQLSGDTDLTRISSSLRQAMSSWVEGVSNNIEGIGIAAVKDYTTKSGTYAVNRTKLQQALESDTGDALKLLISSPKGTTTEEKNRTSGIIYKLKEVIYSEFVSSSSSLLKKSGFENTVTAYNNTLTKSMEDYQKKIDEQEKVFTRKEQLLYSKYATLESMMTKFNSQQSYLSSMLGG